MDDPLLRALELRYDADLRVLVTWDHPAGRRFISELIRRCGYGNPLPTGDHEAMAKAEGRRTVAIDLRQKLAAIDPELPAKLELEALLDETRVRGAGEDQPEEVRPGWE